MNNIEKIYKENKELLDLQNELHQIQQLLNECRWDELEKHLKDIMNKYPVETAMHNLVNPLMPRTIQENARNCITFLSELYTAKTVSIGKDVIK